MSDHYKQELMREAMSVDELAAVTMATIDANARATALPPRVFIVPTSWRRDPVLMKLREGIEKAGYEVLENRLLDVEPVKMERMSVVAGGYQPNERQAQWKREQGFGRGRRRVK